MPYPLVNSGGNVAELPASSPLDCGVVRHAMATNSNPQNGDLWFDGSVMKFREGGATKSVTQSAGGSVCACNPSYVFNLQNSTAYVDVPGVTVTLQPATTYVFRFHIVALCASTPGLKIRNVFSGGSAPGGRWTAHKSWEVSNAGYNDLEVASEIAIGLMGQTSNGYAGNLLATGHVVTDILYPITWKLQIGQITNSANAVTLYRTSSFVFYKV